MFAINQAGKRPLTPTTELISWSVDSMKTNSPTRAIISKTRVRARDERR
jgi:hypothetical protein